MKKLIPLTVAVALGIGIGACAVNPQGNNSGANSPPPSVVGSAPWTPPASEPLVGEPEITLAEFDQIKQGMTYDQITKIIGVAGEVTSSYEASDPKWSSKTYQYKGRSVGSTAMVMFTGGVVSSKSQFGLS
jgi:hypothetical protein